MVARDVAAHIAVCDEWHAYSYAILLQVRSFGKEAAACDRYHSAVLRTQSWGLKSAAAGGLFTSFNGSVTPGQLTIMRVLLWAANEVVQWCVDERVQGQA
jgi:hypothetical protein